MTVIIHLTFATERNHPFLNLTAKPGMYNYMGVGGLRGHAALKSCCFCSLNNHSHHIILI